MPFLTLCLAMPAIAIAHAWCPDNQPLDLACAVSMGWVCCGWWDYRRSGWGVLWALLATSRLVAEPKLLTLVVIMLQPWVVLLIILVGNRVWPRRCPLADEEEMPTKVYHVTYTIRKTDIIDDTGPYDMVCGACGRTYTMVLREEFSILRHCPVCGARSLRPAKV